MHNLVINHGKTGTQVILLVQISFHQKSAHHLHFPHQQERQFVEQFQPAHGVYLKIPLLP